MYKKIRYTLVILSLFVASVLGGALATVVFQPKEACAGCAVMPTKGSAVYKCPSITADSSCIWGTTNVCSNNTCKGQITAGTSCSFSCVDEWNGGCNGNYTKQCPLMGYLVN